jgi:uncharacterized membrane protein
MTKLTIAAAITALVITATVPFTLAQTAPNSAPAPPTAASRGDETSPGMMYGQGQGGYGPSMMGGYGAGWMGGYGGLLVPILLVLAVVGLVVWVVKQKSK